MRLTTLLLPIVLTSTAGAQSVETEIRAEVTRYVAAINSGNATAVAAVTGVMTALGVATESGPAGPNRQTTPCRVVRITDGDGIVCDRIGRVRLIGVDTPELDQKPYGEQSARALGTMIRVGTQVQLEPDVEARDRYGRVLAYVWRDSTLINWRLVREGWAVLLTYPPNVQYVDALAEAERRARDEGKGLWATGGFECTPRDHRARRCD